MQLTPDQIAKLNTSGDTAFATLAHLSAESASIVFADNSLEAVQLSGDKLAEATTGSRVFFNADGSLKGFEAPTYAKAKKAPGEGSMRERAHC